MKLQYAAVLLALTGCASVNVLKVGADDTREGVPFYLPRPYVSVFEPFVVGATAYVVNGQLSPDGQYLLIDNASIEAPALKQRLQIGKAETLSVPSRQVRRAAPPAPKVEQGGGEQGDRTLIPPAAASAAASAADGNGQAAPETALGQFNVSVLNSNAAFAVTPGRRFFDIVWLPDFDEKYIVQAKPGLGNANVSISTGQGWSLQGLDAKLDNSAIVGPLLDLYKTSLGALGQLAKAKIFPPGLLAMGGEQGLIETSQATAGTRLSVKVTIVQVAAPGLYPVLKPAEKAAADAARAQWAAASAGILYPVLPFTSVAFNTYEVMVVEAARPTGDSPMNLQRYFDSGAVPALPGETQAAIKGTPAAGGGQLDLAALTNTVNEKLAGVKGNDGAFWKLSDLTGNADRLTGTMTLTAGRQKPAELASELALQRFVAAQMPDKLRSGNIFLTLK